jgi:capsular exopolysaccharide synthesis family protein
MQRAAGANPEPRRDDETPAEFRLPELDDALLSPDELEGDVFGVPADGVEVPEPAEMPADTPSAVIRTLESEVRGETAAQPAFEADSKVVISENADSIAASAAPPQISVVGESSVIGSRLQTRPAQMVRLPDPTGIRVHPAYDRIVQRLLSFRRTPRQSVVLVSSAVAGEGASTVARNVATALSHSGTENVLLVDANLRSPVQHDEFDLTREKGFSDVLRGEAALTSVIQSDVGLGISLLTCGTTVKSPTRVLTVSAIQGVIMALLSLYDWIIVDSPPATVYPDAASLGTACGAAILVVEAEKTRSEVALEAKGILEGTGAEVLGAVLNRRRYHIPDAIYRRL